MLLGAALWGIGLLQGCVTPPPAQPDDLCAVFSQHRAWYRDARDSTRRWGIPEATQMAIIHQESSFRARARPARSRFLWVFPGVRPSTAYGYGQVIDTTWSNYIRSSGNRGADRDDFGDVTDFIGWYGDKLSKRTFVSKGDARHLYIAYHEGPGGYLRGTHKSKKWLLSVSKKVAARAARYDRQLGECRERLESKRWFQIF